MTRELAILKRELLRGERRRVSAIRGCVATESARMILGSSRSVRVFAYPEPVDLRKGYNGCSRPLRNIVSGTVESVTDMMFTYDQALGVRVEATVVDPPWSPLTGNRCS